MQEMSPEDAMEMRRSQLHAAIRRLRERRGEILDELVRNDEALNRTKALLEKEG